MSKVDWDQKAEGVSKGFDTMPKGRYLCVVSDSERVQTKAKDGYYDAFEFVVVSPKDYKNRKLWANFNIHNPSEEAQRIGREQFNSLADCLGLLGKVKDTKEMHDKYVILLVGIKPADGPYKESNNVLGFQKYEGEQPSARTKEEVKPAAKKEERKPPAGKFDDLEDDIPFASCELGADRTFKKHRRSLPQ